MNKAPKIAPADDHLHTLETHLAGTLRPLNPPRDLVQRLRLRLQFPDRAEIASRLRDWRRLFVVFGGVMSGLLVLITVARALFHILGRRQTM
jgi:hypothetical protein